MKRIRKRLTYSNVMSSIAVFLVLGGATAFAAGLAKNSVGSKQLKKNAVTAAKIKNNAVTAAKIQNGAITGAKVNAASLGTVPNATHAGSADSAINAANAGNANTVGGNSVQKVFARIAKNSTVTVGTYGAFKLVASCSALGDVTLTIDPQTTDTDWGASGVGDTEPFYVREAGAEPNSEEITGNNERGQVNFTGAQSGGAVVTGVLGWDDVSTFGNDPNNCAVWGHMTVSG